MTILVHITDIDNRRSILRSGIKAGYGNIVYFMPHLQEFLISHQWARELKRSGIKKFAAVDFKLKSDEEIWFGNYTDEHEKMALGKAIGIFMEADNKLGYEFFIERNIEPKEILRIRSIRKPLGWRYEPNAHGKRPCPCPMCIQRGGYKTNNLKEKRLETLSRPEAKRIIQTSNDENELWEAVCRLQGKWKRESPKHLERLLHLEDEYLLYDLVKLISEYRHPLAKSYLEELSRSSDEDVKSLSLEYLERR